MAYVYDLKEMNTTYKGYETAGEVGSIFGAGKIVISKQHDSAPLIDTTFENKPCMTPDFKSIDPNPMTIYPLERDRYNVCKVDKAIGFVNDERYRHLGASVSLFNMQ